MKKRVLALMLGGCMALGLLTGCVQNANQQSPAPTGGGDAQPTGEGTEPAGDGIITIALGPSVTTLDPADNTDGTAACVLYALYDRLVSYGTKEENGVMVADVENIQPSIAERWEVSDDQLTWTFYLDPDAVFANGEPVLAEDVEWSYMRTKDNPSSATSFATTNIESVEIIDDHTVQFNLSLHCPTFLELAEMYRFCILDKSQAAEHDDDWLTTNAVGSGPYQVEKFDTSSEIILTAREDYWKGPDAVKNKQIVLRMIPEASNRLLLLQQGDVDLAIDLEPRSLQTLRDDDSDNITVQSNQSNRILWFGMNCELEPFDDPLVRQAICYAIPYDELVESVMYGDAAPMLSCIPTIMPGHIEGDDTHYPYDPEKAKELLAEAGYADGLTFDFTLGSGYSDWQDCAIIIQNALKEIGVTMNIQQVERAQFLEMAAAGQCQAYISRFTAFINDPGYLTVRLYTTGGSFNYNNYSNPEVDALYEEAVQLLDADERNAKYADIQRLVAADAGFAYLYEYNRTVAYNHETLHGYTYHTDETLRFEYLYN